jgi:hypothetical protein
MPIPRCAGLTVIGRGPWWQVLFRRRRDRPQFDGAPADGPGGVARRFDTEKSEEEEKGEKRMNAVSSLVSVRSVSNGAFGRWT